MLEKGLSQNTTRRRDRIGIKAVHVSLHYETALMVIQIKRACS